MLIVDDLLATGGTACATIDLVKGLGGGVEGMVFLIELAGLNGRAKLTDVDIHAVLKYPSELLIVDCRLLIDSDEAALGSPFNQQSTISNQQQTMELIVRRDDEALLHERTMQRARFEGDGDAHVQ